MTAEEARRIAFENRVAKVDVILVEIEKRAKKGENTLYYTDTIVSDVSDRLTELGYTVHKTAWHNNEPTTRIDW